MPTQSRKKVSPLCATCMWAKWDRTKSGRLSTTGSGRCAYPVEQLALPAAFYYEGYDDGPSGGYVNRLRSTLTECPKYIAHASKITKL